MSESITGFVDHIIYRNDENGYTVLVLDSDITVTGIFPTLSDGENLQLTGDFVFHEVYGEQFSATSYEIVVPSSKDDIRRYLGSGAIKGIGAGLAKRIVDRFGEDTFRIFEEEPERLAEIKGISERKAVDIAASFLEKTRDRAAILYLLKYGLNNQMAMRIYRHYGTDIYRIMETNPYKLADDIRGIGFKAADDIAGRIGISRDSDHRIRSGIIYVLSKALAAGHTYLPRDILINNSEKLLNVDITSVEANLMQLSIDKKIAVRGERIYLMYYYRIEYETAQILKALDITFREGKLSVDHFMDNMESVKHPEDNDDIVLDEMQTQAVYMAAQRGVVILTGGPGTGKTTTIKTIIEYFEFAGKHISLCAPTGRAAKRMTESTGREALTIHRLLEVSSSIDEGPEQTPQNIFARCADYPLETDVVIVDEASMVDIGLFHSLLKAITKQTHLILVGDPDQLPSVGPGNVLKDIVDSQKFNVVRLENIFRQTDRSDIVINAHRIQRGELFDIDNDSKDFFFLKRDDAKSLVGTILTLIRDKLPSYVDAKTFDIQVLTPTRKGVIGVDSINTILQKHLNPYTDDSHQQTFGDRIFRVGDKIMQTKNNYRTPWRITDENGHTWEEGLGVYNGDMGRITDVNKYAKLVIVEFDDGKKVEYPYNQLDEIEHAYAVTVHKSQGSEYPAVVIPLMNVPRMLMNRNLIYTAITRARKCVVLVGDENIFREMVANDSVLKRYSGLIDALCME